MSASRNDDEQSPHLEGSSKAINDALRAAPRKAVRDKEHKRIDTSVAEPLPNVKASASDSARIEKHAAARKASRIGSSPVMSAPKETAEPQTMMKPKQ